MTRSREYQLSIKTKASLYPQMEQMLLKNHSYELPEILALPVSKGSRAYLKWIDGETAGLR